MQRILSKYEDYDLSPYFNGIIKFVEKGAKREVF